MARILGLVVAGGLILGAASGIVPAAVANGGAAGRSRDPGRRLRNFAGRHSCAARARCSCDGDRHQRDQLHLRKSKSAGSSRQAQSAMPASALNWRHLPSHGAAYRLMRSAAGPYSGHSAGALLKRGLVMSPVRTDDPESRGPISRCRRVFHRVQNVRRRECASLRLAHRGHRHKRRRR